MHLRSTLLFTFCISFAMVSRADITLPSLLDNDMVLQQNDSVKLWGWALPHERVIITTSWNNRTDSVFATPDAKWEIKVLTPKAGGPYNISFTGKNRIELKNVMIGEVWVCSGQSNMEWGYYQGLKEMQDEMSKAPNPNLRLFHISKTTSKYPQDNVRAKWAVCDSNSLKPFSAVGYFFALKLIDSLHVPVGIINASWGGTPAEVWTPADIIEKDTVLKADASLLAFNESWTISPGYAFNAMIAPLENFSIRGALFYQGEANTALPANYSKLFTTMITAWRNDWHKDFPFYYVQIAPFTYGEAKGYLVREQQAKSLALKNTGMVVVADLVDDTTNIHPIKKHEVGNRLARLALAKTYGSSPKGAQSPIFKEMTIDGSKARISFDDPGSGLVINGKGASQLFIAGTDKVFYPAKAQIKNDVLMVSSKQVKTPVAVRYMFSNAGIGNLSTRDGLPVAPFRTDDWSD